MRISDWSSDVCSSDLDADAWHHGIEPFGQRFGVGRRDRANGGYLEAVVAISHTLQSVALQALGKFLTPPVKRSEEHTSELQSLMRNSYAVFCLKNKNTKNNTQRQYLMRFTT